MKQPIGQLSSAQLTYPPPLAHRDSDLHSAYFTVANSRPPVLGKHNSHRIRHNLWHVCVCVCLSRSVALLNEDGSQTPLDESKLNEMIEHVTSMAKRVSDTHTHTHIHTHTYTHKHLQIVKELPEAGKERAWIPVVYVCVCVCTGSSVYLSHIP